MRETPELIENKQQQSPEASDQADGESQDGKNPHATAVAALGASKGGRARANKLTAEERRLIAREGAIARWTREGGELLPRAVYGSPTQPLRIGKLEIPCYVLDDGRRVLVQNGMITALGMAQGTAAGGPGDRIVKFTRTKGIGPFISDEVAEQIGNPIKFRVATGQIAYGYDATILTSICDAVLAARKAGALHRQQYHIAERCEILVRGLAHTGIIALVDEATGYQEVRARDALAEILEKFIAKELREWVRTFPPEFYDQMCRLRKWDYSTMQGNKPKPLMVGKITDDVIYKRLAPGVRDELRKQTPRSEKGWFRQKLHQRLTEEVGHPKLREHLSVVVALMKISDSWETFKKHVDKVLPRYDKTLPLLLDD